MFLQGLKKIRIRKSDVAHFFPSGYGQLQLMDSHAVLTISAVRDSRTKRVRYSATRSYYYADVRANLSSRLAKLYVAETLAAVTAGLALAKVRP